MNEMLINIAANQASTDFFAIDVFSDLQMRTRLSKSTYQSLNSAIKGYQPLNPDIADEVAIAMKHWAIERGATHYTHWFMPMTGLTAEKHDCFLEPIEDSRVIFNFSGKALIKGEPDASSFPSGGLRETAKARGYTAWDCSSYAFVKEKTLYIPTAFFSHNGEVLDKKAPLLRSLESINRASLRLLNWFGLDNINRVDVMVGAEQEYFLVDKKLYDKRPDLIACGRTLVGASDPKGQELEDQYLGVIRPQVKEFMRDLNQKLWRLGIAAKTEHNEVAPSQHELAIVFASASIACDHNQLIMELLKKTALEHGMECLLHDKPYKGVNGSGKHINWSLATDTGKNLLNVPDSDDSLANLLFLTILASVVSAISMYPDLLAASVASLANESRLGEGEAPPAIVSISVGDELEKWINQLITVKDEFVQVSSKKNVLDLGVNTCSLCTVDTTDRNRTSPFAFTGNKFEFRMPGSSCNIAGPCYMLNTMVAEAIDQLCDEFEKEWQNQEKDELNNSEKEVGNLEESLNNRLTTTVLAVLRRTFTEHKKIIFNGDNYSAKWQEEASLRGLFSLKHPLDAYDNLKNEKAVNLFVKQGVLSEREVKARVHILKEYYLKQLNVEARSMLDLINKYIIDFSYQWMNFQAKTILANEKLGITIASGRYKLAEMASYIDALAEHGEQLKELLDDGLDFLDKENSFINSFVELEKTEQDGKNILWSEEKRAKQIKPLLSEIRTLIDTIEDVLPRRFWSLPNYSDLFFRYSAPVDLEDTKNTNN